jgi:hypothetical protein
MTKGQKKKAAAAAKKAAARANDSSPSQSPPPEDVDTTSDPEANTTMTQPPSDESGVSKPLDDTPTSAPVQDLEGNAWGLNEDEPAVPSDDLTKPTMSDAPVSDAQDSGSADDPQVASTEPKSEDSASKADKLIQFSHPILISTFFCRAASCQITTRLPNPYRRHPLGRPRPTLSQMHLMSSRIRTRQICPTPRSTL